MRKMGILLCLFPLLLLAGCSGEESETVTLPHPTITTTELPPPPDENIVPDQPGGGELAVPTDIPSADESGNVLPSDEVEPLPSPTGSPIPVVKPSLEQQSTALNDASASVSIVASSLTDGVTMKYTVYVGEGVLSYTNPTTNEVMNIAMPEGMIVKIGSDPLGIPYDPVFIEGEYCVSLPNPENQSEYLVLSGPVLAPPDTLPVVRKQAC